ncbi:hypothetical protein KJ632_00775 [Patescibacteria group bacterium]|nr:hypothetical protein [Patescibacteria group bacterium]
MSDAKKRLKREETKVQTILRCKVCQSKETPAKKHLYGLCPRCWKDFEEEYLEASKSFQENFGCPFIPSKKQVNYLIVLWMGNKFFLTSRHIDSAITHKS